MAKRAKARRVELFSKLGLAASILATVLVIAIVIFMLHRWNFSENLIFLGKRSKPALLLGTFLSAILGFGGFLGGLEGASEGEGRIKNFGWLGFWAGVISAMAAVIAGMCIWFYAL